MISPAEFCLNELADWKDSIILNLEKIEKLQAGMKEVLLFNTEADLSNSVKQHLYELILFRQNLTHLKSSILSLELKLYKDQASFTDVVAEDLKRQQNELRKNMHSLEKEYLDIKYDCDYFLAETIARQKKDSDNRQWN